MIKKINANLTFKVFLITALLLSAICLIAVLSMARYIPEVYSNQLSKSIQEQASELVSQLENKNTLDECYPLIDTFTSKTKGVIFVSGFTGEVLYTSGGMDDEIIQDGISTVYDKNVDLQFSENNLLSEISFTFNLTGSNEQYLLSVRGTSQPVSQAVTAIGETLPLILFGIIALSVLCSVFYSRYITKPVLQLSRVSEKMSQFDFSERSNIDRKDEIGVLSDSLNSLSSNLSITLKDLQESNLALEHEIEKEKQLEKQQSEFFSAASHDLKTPMTILLGHLNGILDGVGDYKNPKPYIERSIIIAEQMNDLIQSLLSVARIENDTSVPRFIRSDFSELVRRIVCEMSYLIEAKEHQLEIAIPEHFYCLFDPNIMNRVVRNLIDNAIKYSPAKSRITIMLTIANAKETVFSLENTGVYIPENCISHLFEPFYRADNSRSRDTGGSGLGLYIVKTLLEKHNASYWLKNTNGGVQFSFTLPAMENP